MMAECFGVLEASLVQTDKTGTSFKMNFTSKTSHLSGWSHVSLLLPSPGRVCSSHLSIGTKPKLKMQINCWNINDEYVLGDNSLPTLGFLPRSSVQFVCPHKELDVGNRTKNKLFQQWIYRRETSLLSGSPRLIFNYSEKGICVEIQWSGPCHCIGGEKLWLGLGTLNLLPKCLVGTS